MTDLKKMYDGFVEEAENFFVSKFITSPTIEKEYSDCLDIIFDVTKTVDCGRGIIAFNQKYGQGKSFFFDVINHRFKRIHNGQNLFKRVTAKDLVQIYVSTKNGEDPQQKLIEAISVKRLFIDDIGDEGEQKIFHNYANELNVIRFVLLKRYEFWMEKGWITYGTTNLTIEQMAKSYDGRVSDRLLQMCHWREFKFLKDGSFRQISETRKLTNVEIEKNWLKFKKPEQEVEKVDLEKYFNELIQEPDAYFIGKDISFWTFVKQYLLGKGLLKPEDFENISDQDLMASEMRLKDDVREFTKSRYKHAPLEVRSNQISEALKRIKSKDVLNVAQNKVARAKFMELREKQHKFE